MRPADHATDYHVHTARCGHAGGMMRDYVEAALARGLSEMARVVRPGGRVVVLEFGQPGGPLFGPLFRWYSRTVIPRVGGLLSGRRDAYEYLDRTAAEFPAGARFVNLMLGTGAFAGVTAQPLSGGVAYVYVGEETAP